MKRFFHHLLKLLENRDAPSILIWHEGNTL